MSSMPLYQTIATSKGDETSSSYEDDLISSDVAGPNAPSKQKMHARVCLAVILSISVTVVTVTSIFGKIDPLACTAFAYTFFVMLLQFWMMEWPQCDWRPIFLISYAIMVFMLPTLLNELSLWTFVWRLAAGVFDLALCASTYCLCIRGPSYEPAPESMEDRIVIITGCNTGIGLITAQTLATAGATIIFACRTESKALEAMKEVLSKTEKSGVKESQLKFIQLDLSSMASVRKFVQSFQAMQLGLHVLVCNAGAFFPVQSITQDGFDACLAANHFGHFLLVQLLLPTMLATETRGGKPRIVFVNSALAYEQKSFDFSQACKVEEAQKANFLSRNKEAYKVFEAYGQAKIGSMMCMRELARRLAQHDSQMPVNAVHPGEIDTNITGSLHPVLANITKIFKPIVRLLLKSPYQGSIGTVYACTSPNMTFAEDMTGEFLMRLQQISGNDAWLDEDACKKLWDISIDLTGAPEVVSA